MRLLTDQDIISYEVINSGTVHRKTGDRVPGGLYDLRIFGSVDKCHCGLPIFEGYTCETCAVTGMQAHACYRMPFCMITELKLKHLSNRVDCIKIPKTIKALWGFEYQGEKGVFALMQLSSLQGLEFIKDYLNKFLYIPHPIYRPFIKVKNSYLPDDYTMSLSLFIEECNNFAGDHETLHLLYNEISRLGEGVKTGKDGGLRKLFRYNYVDHCLSAVIIANPGLKINEIGIHEFNLRSVPEEKRNLAILIRYPVLHKYNLMAFKVVPMDTAIDCIQLNPRTVKPFGGDFDGDTMQVIFVNKANCLCTESTRERDLRPLFNCQNEEIVDAFSFSGDNGSLEKHLKQKTLDSIFRPMYNLSTSLINGLSVKDFISLSYTNRSILEVKQDLVAVSGYNTRQLVLALWESEIGKAMSFTEGITQKALSLKHGGDNTARIVLNKESVSGEGIVYRNSGEYFYLSGGYKFENGNIVKDIPLFAGIFPIMRLLDFKLGSLSRSYVGEFNKVQRIKNYAICDGKFCIKKDSYCIGDQEFPIEDCLVVAPGSIIKAGQRISAGVCDLGFYCEIFERELVYEIFKDQVLIHGGHYEESILKCIFDAIYPYGCSVTKAIENKGGLVYWYATYFGKKLNLGHKENDPKIKKLLGCL